MKFFRTFKSPRSLRQAGIAHFAALAAVLVLTGVGGTYALVQRNVSAATPTNRGYLIVFGSGEYDGVQITAQNLDLKKQNCGKKWNGTGNTATISQKLPQPRVTADGTTTYQGIKFTCSSTSGDQSYKISYQKGKATVSNQYFVDIDSEFCTTIQSDGTQEKVAATKGKCNQVKQSAVQKVDPGLQIKGQPTKNLKGINGWVSLVGSGKKITKAMCTGQVNVTVTSVDRTIVRQKNFPIKFADVKDSPYCVAKLVLTGLTKGKEYNVRADYAGGRHFNAGATGVNITIPGDTKKNVVVRSLPEYTNGKSVTGYISVHAPGVDLTKKECVGKVKISYYLLDKGTNKRTEKTQVKALKRITVAGFNDGKGYCVAQPNIPIPKTRKADLEVGVTGTLAATKYLNGGSAGHSITIPASYKP